MTPKQTLYAVLALALLGEAGSELFAENAFAFICLGISATALGLLFKARKTSR